MCPDRMGKGGVEAGCWIRTNASPWALRNACVATKPTVVPSGNTNRVSKAGRPCARACAPTGPVSWDAHWATEGAERVPGPKGPGTSVHQNGIWSSRSAVSVVEAAASEAAPAGAAAAFFSLTIAALKTEVDWVYFPPSIGLSKVSIGPRSEM